MSSPPHTLNVSEAARAKCPAFANGCPFNHATSKSEIEAIMASVPGSHRGENNYISSEFKSMMTALHTHNENKPDEPPPPPGTTDGATAAPTNLLSAALEAASFSIAKCNLAESLKLGTAISHKEAENVSFVKNFLRGKITVPVYAVLIANLYHVYKTMEGEMDRHGKSAMGALYLPTQLQRTARLLADWRFLAAAGPDTFPPITRCAAEYCERLLSISNTNSTLLISHAYTRYLGDLSGGQILQRCAKKAMDLPDSGQGGTFYDFPEIPEGANKFKNTYRDLLDQLELTTAQVDLIVGEANVSFVLNMRIFEELDCIMGVEGASVRPMEDALKFSTLWKEHGNEEEKCPFGFTGPSPHKNKKEVVEVAKEGGRCPWPFIFAHDPQQGVRDWQTWVLIGVVGAYAYNKWR